MLDGEIVLRSYGYEVENQVFWSGIFGDFEGWSLRLWTSLATTSPVVLDVGANTGVYALAARAVNPLADVYAFEPIAPIFAKLSENAALNGGAVHCLEAAATDHTGRVTIFVPQGEHAYSSSLDPEIFGAGTTDSWEPQEVAATRLDAFLDSRGIAPSLIKIDVEGQEPFVLEGLGAELANHRPSLLVEILTRDVAEAVWTILGRLGYEGFEIDEKQGPRPLPRDEEPRAGRNVLFCTPETARGNPLLRSS